MPWQGSVPGQSCAPRDCSHPSFTYGVSSAEATGCAIQEVDARSGQVCRIESQQWPEANGQHQAANVKAQVKTGGAAEPEYVEKVVYMRSLCVQPRP